MQQITTSTPPVPSSVRPDAATEARLPGDGFEALLAGLIGLPMPQANPAGAPQPPSGLPGLPGEALGDGLQQFPESGAEDAGGEGLPAPAALAATLPNSVDAAPFVGAAGAASMVAATGPQAATPPTAKTAAATPPGMATPPAATTATATSPGMATPPAAATAAATPPGMATSPTGKTTTATPPGMATRRAAMTAATTPPGMATPGASSEGAKLAAAASARGAATEQMLPASSENAPRLPASTGAIEPLARRAAGNDAARRDTVSQGPSAVVRQPGVDGAATAAAGLVSAGQLSAMQGRVPLAGFAPMQLMAAWEEPTEGLATGVLASAPGSLLAADGSALPSLDSATTANTPVRQLAIAIERAATGELRHLTVQLSPEALGSIEIALELDADRRLGIAILAERPETLELLRGDARQLERLLGQQGVALADGELSFGLMSDGRGDRPAQDGQARHAFGQDDRGTQNGGDDAGFNSAQEPPGNAAAYVRQSGRLNLSI